MADKNERYEDNISSGLTSTQRVRAIFERIAPGYDSFNAIASFGIDRLWRHRLVREARLKPTDRVLDVAAGTGDLSLDLARRGRPAEVVATDFVPEMLDVAKRKAARYEGPTKLGFAVEDAQALTLPDESFDVVTVAFGVRNFPDRAANFHEVLRVLRPGGRYLILEFTRPDMGILTWPYNFYLNTLIPRIGGWVVGEREHFEYLIRSIQQFPSQDVLAAELREAGFRDVSWIDMTFGAVAIHIARK